MTEAMANDSIRSVQAAALLSCLALRGVAIALAVICANPALAKPRATGAGSLSGIWINDQFNRQGTCEPRLGVQTTADGKLPPLQPWAAELLERRIKTAEAGQPFATTKSQCLPAGMPQMMFGPRLPMQILETLGQVTILIEELTNFRIIRLGGKHPNDPDPSFMGDSVGHWEGATLVVDTIGMTARTTLDPIGMPHSDDLHVVERIRRAGRGKLEVEVWFDDPKTFTSPWVATTAFTAAPPDRRIEEYLCENNRNRPEGPGGTSGVQPATPQ